jgi:hypothetical protein
MTQLRLGLIGLLVLSAACTEGALEAPPEELPQEAAGSALEVQRLRALQLQGGPAYALREEANHLVGEVPSIAASVRHERTATHVVGPQASDLTLEVRGISCDGRFEPTKAAGLELDGNEVKRSHAGALQAVEEWLLGGPLGLEQGFNLNEDKGCERTQIFVAVRGAEVRQAGTNELALSARGDGYRLGTLLAADADGRSLVSRLEAEAEGFVITVETGAARFPVVIDPMLVSLQAAVTVNDPNTFETDLSGDRFIVPGVQGTKVFRRNGVVWSLETTLELATAGRIRGDTIALTGICNNADCVRVYQRTDNTWAVQGELVPPSSVQFFGHPLVVDGDTVAASAVNDQSVFVYRRNAGGSWALEQVLTRPQLDVFGRNVALQGDLLVMQGGGFGQMQGSVHTFTRQGSTWTEDSTVVGPGCYQETPIALSNSRMALGCNGSIRTFQRVGSAWIADSVQLTHPLGPGNTSTFGLRTVLDGDRLLVSTHFDQLVNLGDFEYPTFAAYLYERQGSAWAYQQLLTPPVQRAGFKSLLSGGTALLPTVPSPTNPPAPNVGTYYLYSVADTGCAFSADGVCCDTPCGQSNPFDCQACSVAAGGAVDGVCGPTVAGHVCQPYVDACLYQEVCDGIALECPLVPVPVGDACSDGNACTVGDTCGNNFNCNAGSQVLCDDQNPCTDESCNQATGCVSAPRADGSACMIGCASATCQAGECQVPPDAETCADGNACTADLCEGGGCVNVPLAEGAPCVLGDLCVVNTTCDAQGQCQGGLPLDCNDAAECTEDGCDADEGCTHTPKPDGTPCSAGACDNGECLPSTGAGGEGGGNGVGGANGNGGASNGGAGNGGDNGSGGDDVSSQCSENRAGENSCDQSKCTCNLASTDRNGDFGYLAALAMAFAGARRIKRRGRVTR